MNVTLHEMILDGPADRIAIEAIGRTPLSRDALLDQVDAAAATLRSLGLGPRDTVAVVLPNGPEMATAFLATAIAGISAPLNPAYRRDEFAFYLADLDARLLIIGEEMASPARDVARERGIPIVELGTPPDASAGVFMLNGNIPRLALPIHPEPDATALVLHTSGTTARPKLVPLSHRNLTVSAAQIARALALTPTDRCLNVMPLFHIHGLMAALVASLHAGGSVVCSPGFLSPRFFGWLRDCRPTWYTAVPTMHQAILRRAADPESEAAITAGRLRFIRSSSASLPVRTLEELEATFRVPVIEAYGMTEAAHQMASNPLPPGRRKPGSVGIAAGPEVAVMDREGSLLPQGAIGEVVIRGPAVTAGYVNNPEANARAFTDGWFRTGDEGALDGDGYLTLTGRLKEQINRAGEKISPLEVDGVLTSHPAVAQALTFSVAHPILGEDVAAVVVLKPGATVVERALREFVAARLAYFKVPHQILQVDSIPTGPTGKFQRIGLAERLGVVAIVPVDDQDRTRPRTATEEIVAQIWGEVLGRPALGVRQNFFALGGDSVLATRLVAQVRQRLAVELALFAFFDAPSIEGIAAAIDLLLEAEGADA